MSEVLLIEKETGKSIQITDSQDARYWIDDRLKKIIIFFTQYGAVQKETYLDSIRDIFVISQYKESYRRIAVSKIESTKNLLEDQSNSELDKVLSLLFNDIEKKIQFNVSKYVGNEVANEETAVEKDEKIDEIVKEEDIIVDTAMSDYRRIIADIVNNNGGSLIAKGAFTRVYYYPDIPEKIVKHAKKSISNELSANNIAALIDISFMENGSAGMVFTTSGIYYKALMMSKIYFNYKDVSRIYYDGINIRIEIGDKEFSISNVDFFEDRIIKLVNELKAFVIKEGLETKRVSGKIKKQKMPKEQYNKCLAIIHGAAGTCGVVGAGLAQLPTADTIPITGAQIAMIVALGQVFGLNISDGVAQGFLKGCKTSIGGRVLVQVAFGWLPGAGNVINTTTAAGLTEYIGWKAADQFYNQSLDNIIQYGYQGELQGFKDASEIYEHKFRNQANKFLAEKKVLLEEREELNSIIDEYDVYVAEKEADLDRVKEELALLKKIRDDK